MSLCERWISSSSETDICFFHSRFVELGRTRELSSVVFWFVNSQRSDNAGSLYSHFLHTQAFLLVLYLYWGANRMAILIEYSQTLFDF